MNYLLLPLSAGFALVSKIRNQLYDNGVFRSTSFDVPTIGVGNLVMGGTGKTPMVEWLIRMLGDQYKTAVLSRGYGRKSNGFKMAEEGMNSDHIGDEPFQYFQKFEHIKVYVGEDRVMAIPEILGTEETTELILLDDIMQHRALTPDIMIMMTTYNEPFYKDRFFPLGQLRDQVAEVKRAEIIIVNKCPQHCSPQDQDRWLKDGCLQNHQHIFFSQLEYGLPYSFWEPNKKIELDKVSSAYLFAGIASLELLEEYLKANISQVNTRKFSDHHHFKSKDLDQISEAAKSCEVIITTEKDAARLYTLKDQLVRTDWPLYILPLKLNFGQEQENKLKNYLNQRLEDLSINN